VIDAFVKVAPWFKALSVEAANESIPA
jgi:hypothetical protein